MKTVTYIFSFVTLSVFMCCEKSNIWPPNTKVFGTIRDSTTGLSLDKATIVLKEGPNGTTHNQIVVRTVVTDVDGYYELKFYRENNEYWIDLTCKGHQSKGFFKIKGTGDKQMNFNLY